MRVASAMITWLYCGIVASAAATINEKTCSDNSGLLPLLLSQVSERLTQMGTEILVLKAQTTADAQTLLQMGAEIPVLKIRATFDAQLLSQMGAEILVLKAQTAADAQRLEIITKQLEQAPTSGACGGSTCGNTSDAETLLQMGTEISNLTARTTADAQTLLQMGAAIRILENQSTTDAQTLSQMGTEISVLKAQTTSDPKNLSQMRAEIRVLQDHSTVEAQKLSQMGAEIPVLKNQSTADAQTLSQMGADIRVLQAQNSADAQTLQNMTRQLGQPPTPGGSSFVRWGSGSCGASASLVYTGYVGGSSFDKAGSAANYLCLTLSPRLGDRRRPKYFANLVGAEYETEDDKQDWNPLCAVCSAAFSVTVMIPGTDTCNPGWRRQYAGFLMAGHETHQAPSEFICVDSALEAVEKSGNNDNGKLLYFTNAECSTGLLPCITNVQIYTCVVCSK